jgi:hypothetical protein
MRASSDGLRPAKGHRPFTNPERQEVFDLPTALKTYTKRLTSAVSNGKNGEDVSLSRVENNVPGLFNDVNLNVLPLLFYCFG